jgi:hypothetical protein
MGKKLFLKNLAQRAGRTLDTVSRITVFETVPFNNSAVLPFLFEIIRAKLWQAGTRASSVISSMRLYGKILHTTSNA